MTRKQNTDINSDTANRHGSNRHGGMRILVPLVAMLVVAGMLTTANGRRNGRSWDDEAARRKAEYVYTSAFQQLGRDSMGAAIALLDYAEQLAPDDPGISGNAAIVRMAVQHLDSLQALEAYRKIWHFWQTDPKDYFLGQLLTQMAGNLEQYNDVVHIWEALDSLYPAKSEPAVNLAQALTHRYIFTNDTADYRRSLELFDRVERDNGKDVGLTSQKVRTLLLRNDTVAVDREISSLLSANGTDAESFLYAGALNEKLGRDSVALSYYNRSVELDSTGGRAYQYLANYYRQRNDSVAYDREVFRALCSPSLDFDTKQEIMTGYVTGLYEDSAQWPRIEHLFEVLDRINGDEGAVHTLYGAFEATRGNNRAAREQFGYAVSLEPTDRNMSMLVQTDAELDSLDAVLADARRGMDIFPDNLYYPVMAANALGRQKNYDAGIALLKSVDIGDAPNKRACSTLVGMIGDFYSNLEQRDSALVYYEKAIALDPDNYLPYNNAAYFMAENNSDLDRAARYAGYAVASDPENATYLDTQAWVYFKQKKYKEAKDVMDKALLRLIMDGSEFADADTSATVSDTVPAEDIAVADTVDLEAVAADTVAADTLVLEDLVIAVANEDFPAEEADAEIISHAGDIYFMSGLKDKALQFWRKALALKPDDELLKKKVDKGEYIEKGQNAEKTAEHPAEKTAEKHIRQ